jgi:NAD(P)H dehydrogenase (quinone)
MFLRRMTRLSALAVACLCLASVAGAAQPGGATVLVAYYSKTGATEKMARAVGEGARSVAGTNVSVKAIDQVTDKDLLSADAIIVGSPVYNGGAAAAVRQFIERWPFGKLKDKVGAAFCTSGAMSAGEELALMEILSSMLVFQFVLVGGDTWQAAFGASAVTEEGKAPERQGVDEAALAKARGLGARVARVAARLRGL